MIRHISIFTFLDKPANGKTKEENIQAVRAYLDTIPQLYPAVRRQVIGSSLGGNPPMPDDAPVMFGDLVQVMDFDTTEDAMGYGPSQAHGGLVELSSPMMKKVTAIDFEI